MHCLIDVYRDICSGSKHTLHHFELKKLKILVKNTLVAFEKLWDFLILTS